MPGGDHRKMVRIEHDHDRALRLFALDVLAALCSAWRILRPSSKTCRIKSSPVKAPRVRRQSLTRFLSASSPPTCRSSSATRSSSLVRLVTIDSFDRLRLALNDFSLDSHGDGAARQGDFGSACVGPHVRPKSDGSKNAKSAVAIADAFHRPLPRYALPRTSAQFRPRNLAHRSTSVNM